MKKLLGAAVLSSVLVLGACGNDENKDDMEGHEHHEHDEVAGLDVELTTPETATAGEEVEFVAHVTSNDEDVNDADEVLFEVLKDDESLDKIEGEFTENGLYKLNYTFKEAGTYEVISHVDANGLHTMPKNEVVVE